MKRRDPRFQGLGGAQPARCAERVAEAAEVAALVMDSVAPPMTPQQRIDLAVSIAGKVCDAADVAEARREGAATARTRKRVPKKAKILAEIEKARASGWNRESASRIAQKFRVKPHYVRRLKNGAK